VIGLFAGRAKEGVADKKNRHEQEQTKAQYPGAAGTLSPVRDNRDSQRDRGSNESVKQSLLHSLDSESVVLVDTRNGTDPATNQSGESTLAQAAALSHSAADVVPRG
jgi:hypothetical protein